MLSILYVRGVRVLRSPTGLFSFYYCLNEGLPLLYKNHQWNTTNISPRSTGSDFASLIFATDAKLNYIFLFGMLLRLSFDCARCQLSRGHNTLVLIVDLLLSLGYMHGKVYPALWSSSHIKLNACGIYKHIRLPRKSWYAYPTLHKFNLTAYGTWSSDNAVALEAS